MNVEIYTVVSDADHCSYEFFSEGPNGRIKKLVLYREMLDNFFNLSFGDWDMTKEKIDDTVRSNNNDKDKVLSTVASTIIDFIKHYPRAMIFVSGSTESRTGLYRIKIFTNWYVITQLFEITGFADGEWSPINEQKNYLAFILKAK